MISSPFPLGDKSPNSIEMEKLSITPFEQLKQNDKIKLILYKQQHDHPLTKEEERWFDHHRDIAIKLPSPPDVTQAPPKATRLVRQNARRNLKAGMSEEGLVLSDIAFMCADVPPEELKKLQSQIQNIN